MLLQKCVVDGRRGARWGRKGKCYTGPSARKLALRQAQAIKASGFTENVRRKRTKTVASNPLKADPTRTITLRQQFVREFTKRFARLKSKMIDLIVVEDAFGLKQTIENYNPSQPRDSNSLTRKAEGEIILPRGGTFTKKKMPDGKFAHVYRPPMLSDQTTKNILIENQRWSFKATSQQVMLFEAWLEQQVQAGILEKASRKTKDAYWKRYVEEGYRKGAGRAFDDTRAPVRAAMDAASKEKLAFYEGSKAEFLRSSFARPVAIDKVKLLAGRVFTDLKGVTQAMAAAMTRTLTDGLAQGKNPRAIARDLAKNVDGIGKHRAMLIARTEIIRAHAEGQLDAMERLGVAEVGVMVEWSTAGDGRVCQLCQSMDGVTFKVEEARGLIPRHPLCRCAHIPANVGESTKGQISGKSKAEAAIDKSVKAEIPKRSKRTLAQQKTRSKWGGADTVVAKKRPESILSRKKKK